MNQTADFGEEANRTSVSCGFEPSLVNHTHTDTDVGVSLLSAQLAMFVQIILAPCWSLISSSYNASMATTSLMKSKS